MLNMKTDELRMVADHMGHDLNIHASHYSLQTDVMERTKVAKILLAVDDGIWAKSNSSSLESIQIERIPVAACSKLFAS